jgi:hypothetical protein
MMRHHEISCPRPRCSCRAYRTFTPNLQTLFRLIATDQTFRDVFTVSANDEEIVILLRSLHSARGTAKRSYGAHV